MLGAACHIRKNSESLTTYPRSIARVNLLRMSACHNQSRFNHYERRLWDIEDEDIEIHSFVLGKDIPHVERYRFRDSLRSILWVIQKVSSRALYTNHRTTRGEHVMSRVSASLTTTSGFSFSLTESLRYMYMDFCQSKSIEGVSTTRGMFMVDKSSDKAERLCTYMHARMTRSNQIEDWLAYILDADPLWKCARDIDYVRLLGLKEHFISNGFCPLALYWSLEQPTFDERTNLPNRYYRNSIAD
jgi:hypothetical protein